MWCITFSFSPSSCCSAAKRTSESNVAPKMKGTFYSKPNIRMRDIWKTSNELERQGSSKLIWFAPGHSKKPLVFPLCHSTQGKNKEKSLVSKDPFFLLMRNMQLALLSLVLRILTLLLLETSWRYTNVTKTEISLLVSQHLLNANLPILSTLWLRKNVYDFSQTEDVQPERLKESTGSLFVESYLILILCLP